MSNSNEGKKDEAPGQNKELTIVVNGRSKTFVGKKITFTQVVQLAFGDAPGNANTIYTVTYRKGDPSHHEGVMVQGDEIPVKDGMIFNVTPTDKS